MMLEKNDEKKDEKSCNRTVNPLERERNRK